MVAWKWSPLWLTTIWSMAGHLWSKQDSTFSIFHKHNVLWWRWTSSDSTFRMTRDALLSLFLANSHLQVSGSSHCLRKVCFTRGNIFIFRDFFLRTHTQQFFQLLSCLVSQHILCCPAFTFLKSRRRLSVSVEHCAKLNISLFVSLQSTFSQTPSGLFHNLPPVCVPLLGAWPLIAFPLRHKFHL